MHTAIIIDDSKTSRSVLRTILEKNGYEIVAEAANGEEGFEKYCDLHPDFVTLDITMPVMDGIAATKAIRAMDRADAKTIPIIAMTANAFEEDAKRCLAAGMTAHLAKPFQIEDVEKTIVECCGK